MTQAQLKETIINTAKEADCTELEIISAMQSQCAKTKEENTLEMLCELKWDFI